MVWLDILVESALDHFLLMSEKGILQYGDCVTYNNTSNTLCPIKCLPCDNYPTRCDNNLFIVCSPPTKLSPYVFLPSTCLCTANIKLPHLLIFINDFCSIDLFSHGIIRVGHLGML